MPGGQLPEIYHITVDNAVPSATTQSDVYSLGCIMLQVRQLLFIRIASCNVSVLITCTLDFVWPSAIPLSSREGHVLLELQKWP